MASLHNPEIEKFVLAGLLLYPDTWGDVNMVLKEGDWSKNHKAIFSIIKQQLDKSPPESVAPVVIAEKLKSYGVSVLEGGVGILDFLEAVKILPIDKKEVTNLVKQLKQTTVKRDLVNICESVKNELIHGKDKSFSEMTSLVESSISGITTSYFKEETTSLLAGLVEEVEERGNNPKKAEDCGYHLPIISLSNTIGGLKRGDFVTVASRTGGGKSSLGFFMNFCLAEKYDLPVLHLDKAEMTIQSLRARCVVCASLGRIPLHAVYSGEFRLNKEWLRIFREEVTPRIRKVEKNIHFINVGGMDAKAITGFVRRYHYNKIGREKHLLIHDDYIKGSQSLSKNTQEYQSVGYYVDDMKSLITNDIEASVWTSVQRNREGIYTGKQGKEIIDSESSFGLSDRILQSSSIGMILRFKVPSELAEEKNLFGNARLSIVKGREYLGRDYEKMILPVKTPDGRFVDNYFNLLNRGFYYEDKGDARYMMEVLGNTVDTVNTNQDKITKNDLL